MVDSSTLAEAQAPALLALPVENGPASERAPDSPSFADVFRDQLDYVWATFRRLGVKPSDLADQAQELFIIVHQLMDDYDPRRPIRPWLFGIAYRCALRYRARPQRWREVPMDEPMMSVPGREPSPEEGVAAIEDRALVLGGILAIELSRRAVFVLIEIEGFDVPTVARELNIPLNTAYSRLRLAREDFRRAVARLRPEGGRE